jgi:hypothetical protein
MSTQRKRLPVTSEKKPPVVDKYPGRRFPVQHEIQKLQEELNAFNDRIAELEDEGSSRSCDGSIEATCTRFRTPDR